MTQRFWLTLLPVTVGSVYTAQTSGSVSDAAAGPLLDAAAITSPRNEQSAEKELGSWAPIRQTRGCQDCSETGSSSRLRVRPLVGCEWQESGWRRGTPLLVQRWWEGDPRVTFNRTMFLPSNVPWQRDASAEHVRPCPSGGVDPTVTVIDGHATRCNAVLCDATRRNATQRDATRRNATQHPWRSSSATPSSHPWSTHHESCVSPLLLQGLWEAFVRQDRTEG